MDDEVSFTKRNLDYEERIPWLSPCYETHQCVKFLEPH